MDTAAPALPRHPKFVRWALMLGIVIILNIFFVELVQLVLPSPQYDAYCPTSQVVGSYDTQDACLAVGGQWTANPPQPTVNGVKPASGYCDPQYTCRNQYQQASDLHARNAFIAFVVFGVIALVAGVVPIGSSIVSSGLSYGGVLALIIGSAQYWGNAAIWIRFLIALVGLAALLYIGWRQFRD
jgi:hypothetical protein